MAAKKGEIPAHVKKKEFSHPNTQHPVIYILEKCRGSPQTFTIFPILINECIIHDSCSGNLRC